MHNVLSLIFSTKKGSNVNHFLLGPARPIWQPLEMLLCPACSIRNKTETYNGTESWRRQLIIGKSQHSIRVPWRIFFFFSFSPLMEKRANLDRVPFSRFFLFPPFPICHVPHSCPATNTPVRQIYPLRWVYIQSCKGGRSTFSMGVYSRYLFLFLPELTCPPTFFFGGEGASWLLSSLFYSGCVSIYSTG